MALRPAGMTIGVDPAIEEARSGDEQAVQGRRTVRRNPVESGGGASLAK